ncbi:MAG: hypothetical protein ACLP2P_09800 [Desulfobaccales bacterium]
MKLLVRDEIQEVFQENNIDYTKYIKTLLEWGDANNFIPVTFNIDNTSVIDIKNDDEINQYLKYKKVDSEDILLVSSIICDGFLKLIRAYYDTLESTIMGKSNDKL